MEPTPATAQHVPPRVEIASYLLMAATLLLVLWHGLLPGLLCVCLGYVLTQAWAGWLARLRPGATPSTPPTHTHMLSGYVCLIEWRCLGGRRCVSR